jgi:HK97 family phage major capsid protein
MNPTVIPDLIDMKNSGNYPVWQINIGGAMGTTILGMPVVFTEKLPPLGSNYSVVLADFSYYVIGDRAQTEIASSQHYAFINNQTTWRFLHRVEGQPWLDGPIYMPDATNKVSPFVALGGE